MSYVPQYQIRKGVIILSYVPHYLLTIMQKAVLMRLCVLDYRDGEPFKFVNHVPIVSISK